MPPKFTEQQLKDALFGDMNALESIYDKELSDSPGYVPVFIQFPQARPLMQEQLMEDDDAKASYTGSRDDYLVPSGRVSIYEVADREALEEQLKVFGNAIDHYEKKIDQVYDAMSDDPLQEFSKEEIEYAREYKKVTEIDRFKHMQKGYGESYLGVKLTIAGGYNALWQADIHASAADVLEAIRIEKNGLTVTVSKDQKKKIEGMPFTQGYMGFCRILNTYADYWEAQEKGTLTPVSVVERREKLLEQIEDPCS